MSGLLTQSKLKVLMIAQMLFLNTQHVMVEQVAMLSLNPQVSMTKLWQLLALKLVNKLHNRRWKIFQLQTYLLKEKFLNNSQKRST